MPQIQTDFLKISDAAKFLGVAPNTLRSWSETGKVQEYRHPINNYRLYKKADLEELNACLCQPIRVVLKRTKKQSRKAK
ncbi:MAG TPA: MerR family DNA-binding transcriptional regulator [Pirellulaceae bacterium]|nr:MerR family DNA-binding transcriptional regulator [Pirellulaceae bacterium]HMO93556.1 MerR family DNA-binding transcriptional regulator [Pirellulaceae bacterium]HMP71105.1 MerR family DNA-binding transcriptional regulator [Pirellulaceae bacterium]